MYIRHFYNHIYHLTFKLFTCHHGINGGDLLITDFIHFYLFYPNQVGQFIIEYCGEVISWKDAKRRSQAYEIQGEHKFILYKSMLLISQNPFHHRVD